nr:hypothetical protein [Clostridium botulinum]
MGIKKRYSWNSEKNEFEEREKVNNTNNFDYVKYINEKIIKEESEREVDYRTEYIQYYITYLMPLIILIIVIAFGNMITSDWFIKKLIYLHTM